MKIVNGLEVELEHIGIIITSCPNAHGYRSATCNYCPKHWGRDAQGKWKKPSTAEATNNILVTSEFIDLTNPSIFPVPRPQTSMRNNITNQNQFRNVNYKTRDLIDRMFEEHGES
ncbi:9432_t:CDS:2 [Funneliformis caledonium]|uniref:9432_t:CDS:1 n=1 Tax=Funneliformis caledonium TaxID=1117310 RepID=A0A9N9ARW0_9GLOM|nr:9432_t:CDS:2 [Funneliformis caledonium]